MRKKHLLFTLTLGLFLVGSYTVKAQSFAANIVSQWSFNGSAVDSKTGAVGEILGDGGTEYIDGRAGQALDFTNAASNSIVMVLDDGSTLNALNFTDQSFSVSIWVICDPTLATEQTLIMKGSNTADDADENGNIAPGANGQRYNLHVKGGEVRFAIDDDVTKSQLGLDVYGLANGYPEGWVNIVGVRDRASGNLYLYLNGEYATEMVDGTGDLNIAGQPLFFGNFTNRANIVHGPIDDAIIVNKALSATEIMELYTTTSIHSPKYQGNLTIQPTFVNNSLSIHGISEFNTIEIYNLTGALVKSISNVENSASIDVNELTTGKYIVKGIGSNKVSVGSFIKQ